MPLCLRNMNELINPHLNLHINIAKFGWLLGPHSILHQKRLWSVQIFWPSPWILEVQKSLTYYSSDAPSSPASYLLNLGPLHSILLKPLGTDFRWVVKIS